MGSSQCKLQRNFLQFRFLDRRNPNFTSKRSLRLKSYPNHLKTRNLLVKFLTRRQERRNLVKTTILLRTLMLNSLEVRKKSENISVLILENNQILYNFTSTDCTE